MVITWRMPGWRLGCRHSISLPAIWPMLRRPVSRHRSPFYRALSAAQDGEVLSPLNQAVNQFGILGGSRMDLRAGSFEPTGNTTDLAIEGPGYFSVQTSARNPLHAQRKFPAQRGAAARHAGRRFCPGRAGNDDGPDYFAHRDRIRQSRRHSIRGWRAGGQAAHRSIRARNAPCCRKEIRTTPLRPAAELPATDSSVRQGMLETSNINPVEGAVSLILLQRQADLLGRALTTLSTDFDRAAAQDVPRV